MRDGVITPVRARVCGAGSGGRRSLDPVTRLRPLVTLVLALAILTATTPAHAFMEGDATWAGDPGECEACHRETWPSFDTKQGPHSGYSATTDKCEACHTVHVAPASLMLLPSASIKGTCFTCHDGSGGMGVYGAIAARGLSTGAMHRIDTTSLVPGGDAVTGGSAVATFGGQSHYLSCDDCHSPHNAGTVAPFRGERVRFHATEQQVGAPGKEWRTSKLLKQRPTGSDVTATVYGSDWCLACHKGRRSGAGMNNHPVESSTSTTTPFYYDSVAIVTTDTSFETTFGTMGLLGTSTPDLMWHSRGFVMPSPRTQGQRGHAPICQQCHEDARDVGAVGAVTPALVVGRGDGVTDTSTTDDVPRFQTFPHEGQNARFLVEMNDDLCTNCHPPAQLP